MNLDNAQEPQVAGDATTQEQLHTEKNPKGTIVQRAFDLGIYMAWDCDMATRVNR